MMMDAKKNLTKKQILLIVGGFLVVLAGVGVWYVFVYNQYGVSVAPGVQLGVPKAKPIETGFQGELFQSSKFQELKMHGRLPVEAGTKGVPNPFAAPVEEEQVVGGQEIGG